MPMPPIGRSPSSGDVDFGTGIYLIAGVHASIDSSETDSAGVSALETVRGGVTVSDFGAVATDVEDFTEAEDKDSLTTEEEDGTLTLDEDEDFATLELDFGATALDAGLGALEAIAGDLGASALDAGADADETATDG